MGVTGSGKTFTMANVIQAVQRPTLVLSHNKTLAAQLYSEFKDFFPNNAVHYFVSYYDYYQPEAYIPQRDIYIEKDASINQEIDRLRLAATSAAGQPPRRDHRGQRVVHLRLGFARGLRAMMIALRRGQTVDRDELLMQAGRRAVRAERHRISPAASFASAAIAWSCGRLTRNMPADRIVGGRGRAAVDHQSHQRRGDSAGGRAVHLSGQALRHARGADRGGRRRRSSRSWKSGWSSCKDQASCSKPNGSTPARGSTSR